MNCVNCLINYVGPFTIHKESECSGRGLSALRESDRIPTAWLLCCKISVMVCSKCYEMALHLGNLLLFCSKSFRNRPFSVLNGAGVIVVIVNYLILMIIDYYQKKFYLFSKKRLSTTFCTVRPHLFTKTRMSQRSPLSKFASLLFIPY